MGEEVICEKCEHSSTQHAYFGMHRCLFDECDCKWFKFPDKIKDTNEKDPVHNSEEPIRSGMMSVEEARENLRRTIGLPSVSPSGEVRTTSSTGGQKGVKPERYDLLPVEAMDIMARLYGFGAQKYAAHNWRKGYEWSKSFASLMRHATRFWAGEDLDEETGLPHLAGAAFHCFTLMVFMDEHPEFDDRFKRGIANIGSILSEEVGESDGSSAGGVATQDPDDIDHCRVCGHLAKHHTNSTMNCNFRGTVWMGDTCPCVAFVEE